MHYVLLIGEETLSVLPVVPLPCVPLRPFWCLCHSIGCYRSKDCATSIPLPCKLGGRAAQPRCEREGVGARVVPSQSTRLGWWGGFGNRESPPGLEAQGGLPHLLSIKELCEDEHCCVQDGCCGLFGGFFLLFPHLCFGADFAVFRQVFRQ